MAIQALNCSYVHYTNCCHNYIFRESYYYFTAQHKCEKLINNVQAEAIPVMRNTLEGCLASIPTQTHGTLFD